MNIFEFLGQPADLRTEKKVVQLVKHYDDVNPKAEEGILHKKVKFPMYGQVKKDGVFSALVIREDGQAAIFNRTGKRMTNVQHLEEYYSKLAFSGILGTGVYFGELCCSGISLEMLSGIVNPNRVEALDGIQIAARDRMAIFFFDYVLLCDFIEGESNLSWRLRYTYLRTSMTGYSAVLPYEKLECEEAVRNYAEFHTNRGEEGIIIKQDVEWKAGAKDWHQMKIVRGLHYDLECIGWEEGTGKYSGKVANLLFRFKNGKTIKAMLGKGWTIEDARIMWLSLNGYAFNREHNPIGKIFHVSGLQPSSKNGLIRLPKVRELRMDKTEADF